MRSLTLVLTSLVFVGGYEVAAQPKPPATTLTGSITWTTVNAEGDFKTEWIVRVDGTFRGVGRTKPCQLDHTKLGPRAIILYGYQGTITWSKKFTDSSTLDTSTPEGQQDAKTRLKRSDESAKKKIEYTERQNDNFVYFDGAYGTLGCIYLDPDTKKLGISEPWWSSRDNRFNPGEVSAKFTNFLNQTMKDRRPEERADLRWGYGDATYKPGEPRFSGRATFDRPDEPAWKKTLEWSFGAKVPDDLTVDGPPCACGTAGKPSEVTFFAKGGADVESWEVKAVGGGKPATIKAQTKGKGATITLVGDPKTTTKTQVVASYKKQSGPAKTPPKTVSFCDPGDNKLGSTQSGAYKLGPAIDFWYTMDEPNGKLAISVETTGAWLDGKRLPPSDVDWSMARDGEKLFKDKPLGKAVLMEALALPDNGALFGPNQIKAKVAQGDCTCESKPVDVRLFFPLSAMNHGGAGKGKTPNWFHYWMQTKAGQLADGTRGNATYIPVLKPAGVVRGTEFARYDFQKDTVFISALVVDNPCHPRSPTVPADEAIDCFAISVRHENHHRHELRSWWTPARLKTCPVPGKAPCADDSEFDLVPDDLEAGLGCQVTTLASPTCKSLPKHLSGLTDVEVHAYAVGWQWVKGSGKDIDWACPGENCKENSGYKRVSP